MIPLYVKPENFLSYGEGLAPLDFTTFNVACLAGRNGAGKSALLDAFTWALWDKARVNDHDQLVRRGAFRMSVELGFEAGGTEYRVIRTYDRSNKRHDVYLHEKDDEGFVLVAEKPREVAGQIERIVGLDYDVFLASSYLRQGDADHFIRLKRRERKSVLFEILGLNRVLSLGDAARAVSGEINDELGYAERELETIDETLKTEPEVKTRQAATEKAEKEAADTAKSVRGRLDEARAKAERFRSLSADLESGEKKMESRKGELAGAEKAVDGYQAEIKKTEKVVAEKEKIEADFEKYRAASLKLQTLDKAYRERKELETAATVIEAAAGDRREAVKREHAVKETELGNANAKQAEADAIIENEEVINGGYAEFIKAGTTVRGLEEKALKDRRLERDISGAEAALGEELARLQTESESVSKRLTELGDSAVRVSETETARDKISKTLKKVEKDAERLADLERESDATAVRIERARARAEELSAAVKDLGSRVDAVSSVEVKDCPTCDRPFNDESRSAAVKNLSDELEYERTRLDAVEEEVAVLERRADELSAEVKVLAEEKPQANAAALRSQLGRLENELESARGDIGKSEKMTLELKELKKAIKKERTEGEFAKKISELTNIRTELGFSVEALESAVAEEKRLSVFEPRKQELERAKKTAEEATAEIKTLEAKLAELDERLTGDFLDDSERKELEALRRKADEIPYDPKERETVAAEMKGLSDAEEMHSELVKAEAALAGLRENERLAKEKAASLKANIEEAAAAVKKIKEGLKELEGADKELTEAEKAAAEADERRLAARDELAAAAEQVKALERAKDRRKEIEESAGDKQKAVKIYDYLTAAFGQNGIPARMLDHGLAELEELANELLARLTDGRFTMTVETVAPKKSGEGVIDTLEVKISDGGAPRDYELFSGGEAFRCDFALRVGLAKLLSRRVGVPLRFLILDEGFGTQDPDGLDAVVECINEISADFEKILVISHLPELRDRFGTRIEVTKDAGGISKYEVVG